MVAQSPISIRIYAGAFAIVLGLQSVWLLAAEITRPALPFFPVNGAEAKTTAKHYSEAAAAARIGWPRGGLWVDYAVVANAVLLGDIEDGVIPSANRQSKGAYSITETAAALAPSDARAWLLLASADTQSPSKDGKALAQLKMSYYTSPYSEHLFPLRIQIVARSAAPFDDELRSFIEYELGVIIRHKPGLKRSIASAFRIASPAGRHFLETSIGTLDPNFLTELQTAKP